MQFSFPTGCNCTAELILPKKVSVCVCVCYTSTYSHRRLKQSGHGCDYLLFIITSCFVHKTLRKFIYLKSHILNLALTDFAVNAGDAIIKLYTTAVYTSKPARRPRIMGVRLVFYTVR